MSSLSPQDRVSLCIFTYADGRRCRLPRASMGTPRTSSHPAGAPPSFSEGGSSHLCHYHAQKESRAATADKLAKDLSAFFSGHYISANDVATAVARLIPAVIRGDIKPRTARTVAYMAQTLLQSIHLAQSEFKDAFGQDALRKSVRTGIASNHDRLFPPEPQPHADPTSASPQPTQHPATSPTPAADPVCHSERSEEPWLDPAAPTTTETRPTPASQATTTQSPEPTNQPVTPSPAPRRRQEPPRDPYAIRFDHTYRLREPEKAY
jgi:hypothetical protein